MNNTQKPIKQLHNCSNSQRGEAWPKKVSSTLYAFFFLFTILCNNNNNNVSMWRKNTLKQSINMVLLSITIVQVKHLLPIDLKEIKWPKQMSMTWLTATNICVTNDHQIMFHLSQSQFGRLLMHDLSLGL